MGIYVHMEVSKHDVQGASMSNLRDVGVDQGKRSLVGREVAHDHRDGKNDDEDDPVESV